MDAMVPPVAAPSAAPRRRRRPSPRLLAAGLALAGAAALGAPTPTPAQGRQVSFRGEDALGGTYDMRRFRGDKVVVAVFTAEEASDTTEQLFVHLDRALLPDPQVHWLSVADVRGYGNILTRGIAESKLESSMRDGLADRKRRIRRNHQGTPPSVAENWRLFGDFDGRIIRAFGIRRELGDEPVTVVVDGRGRRSRAFVGHSRSVANRILAAIEQARKTLDD